MRAPTLTRRAFVSLIGGAAGSLALGVSFGTEVTPPTGAGSAGPHLAPGLTPSAFFHLDSDGTVRIVCHRSEMGQGIRSSLPVVIAEEMGADWARVRVEQADGDPRYGNQNTDGSRSVRDFLPSMRLVGATARLMLIQAAAARWRVPAAGLTAQDHAVQDLRRRRTLSFGELAAAAAAGPVPVPEQVVLRPRAELRRVGGELPLIDAPAYVTGAARFGADVRLPGMLVAVIARPPVVGGTVRRLDESAAHRVPGVRHVVRLPDGQNPPVFHPLGGVAVVATDTWAALRGRAALVIDWDGGANAGYDSAAYAEALRAAVNAPGQPLRQVGDADGALAGARRLLSAEYHVPHLSQAPMEPPVALARYDAAGTCEVWAATQHPQSARKEVAAALGLAEDQVTVHVTFLGGGFGRKSKPDFIVEAALLSRAVGAPVRVQWTRTDDLRHGYYHAVSTQRIDAALDDAGRVVAWRQRVASPSISSTFKKGVVRNEAGEFGQGLLDLPLAVPHVRMEACEARAHVRIGWMRSVYNINHAFAVQSFIAEIAAATRRDPREVLLEVIGPPRPLSARDIGTEKIPNYGASLDEHPVDVARLRGVIERVTANAGWEAARQAGRAVGLAAHRSFLSYVAVVAAVVRDARGGPRIDEVWVAGDFGAVVNRDRVRAQLEGAVLFGISLALHGAITARGGAVEQSNFRDYPIARIGEAPRAIHVDILASDALPGGVGEPGVPPVAPAIMNAVFALTGTRHRTLPLQRATL